MTSLVKRSDIKSPPWLVALTATGEQQVKEEEIKYNTARDSHRMAHLAPEALPHSLSYHALVTHDVPTAQSCLNVPILSTTVQVRTQAQRGQAIGIQFSVTLHG